MIEVSLLDLKEIWVFLNGFVIILLFVGMLESARVKVVVASVNSCGQRFTLRV
jgi:hypothetical protein